jgi:hypothetical protein
VCQLPVVLVIVLSSPPTNQNTHPEVTEHALCRRGQLIIIQCLIKIITCQGEKHSRKAFSASLTPSNRVTMEEALMGEEVVAFSRTLPVTRQSIGDIRPSSSMSR